MLLGHRVPNIQFQELGQSSSPASVHGAKSATFGMLGTAYLKAALESKAIAVAASILPTSGQELLHPLHNIRSEELKPITTPDPLSIVVYVAIGLLGMANPKAALKSKATMAAAAAAAAAAAIRLTIGQEFPLSPHNLRSQELGSLTTPDPLYIVVFLAVAL